MDEDELSFEDDGDIDIDIDIVDTPNPILKNHTINTNNNNNNNNINNNDFVNLNKDIKLSLLLYQKDTLIEYLKNINVDNELVQLLNENINNIISNQFLAKKENNNKDENDKKQDNNNNNKAISTNETINMDNEYVKKTQTFLSESVSFYHKFNLKDSIIVNKKNSDRDPYKIKRFKRVLEEPKFEIPNTIHSEIVQITAPKEEIEKRVKTFTSLKKSENERFNIVEFIDDDFDNNNDLDENTGDTTTTTTTNNRSSKKASRCLAIPPSKMKITKTYNLTGPLDNIDSSTNSIQQPFIDDRLSIIENHLKLVVPPVPIDIYQRVKLIEQKMLLLEEKNPVLFKDMYDEMKRNSTVDHSTPVVKILKASHQPTSTTSSNNNNNNSNNNNNDNSNKMDTSTTTTTNNNNDDPKKPKLIFKFKKP